MRRDPRGTTRASSGRVAPAASGLKWLVSLAFALMVSTTAHAAPAVEASTTIVLVDGSGSMTRFAVDDGRTRWDAARASVASIIESLPIGTRIEMLVFGSTVDEASARRFGRSWSLDSPETRRRALEFIAAPTESGSLGRKWDPTRQGTALYDAMGWALDRAAAACAEGRRVQLVILSDGDDSDSTRWAPDDPPPAGKRSLCRRLAELRATCLAGLEYQFWRADRSIVAPCGADSIGEGLGFRTLAIEADPVGSTRLASPSLGPVSLELDVRVPEALRVAASEPLSIRFRPIDGGPAVRVSPSQLPLRSARSTVTFEAAIRSITTPYAGTLEFEWNASGASGIRATPPAPIAISFAARPTLDFDEFLVRPIDGATFPRHRTVQFFAPPIEGATALWDFGDGQSAVGFVAEHAYTAVGPKSVALRIMRAGSDPLILSRSIEVVEVAVAIEVSQSNPVVGDEVVLKASAMGPVREFRWFVDGALAPGAESDELRHRLSRVGETTIRLVATSDFGDAETTLVLNASEPVEAEPEEASTAGAASDQFLSVPGWSMVPHDSSRRDEFQAAATFVDLSRIRVVQVMDIPWRGAGDEFRQVVVRFVWGPPRVQTRTERLPHKVIVEGSVARWEPQQGRTFSSMTEDEDSHYFNLDGTEVAELVRILEQVGRYTGTRPLAEFIARCNRKPAQDWNYRWFLIEVAIESRQRGDWQSHAAAAGPLGDYRSIDVGDNPDALLSQADAAHEYAIMALREELRKSREGEERRDFRRSVVAFEKCAENWARVDQLDSSKVPRWWGSRTRRELQPLIDQALALDNDSAKRAAERWLTAMALVSFESDAQRLREQARTIRRELQQIDEATVVAEADAGEAARSVANETLRAAGGVIESIDCGGGVLMELIRLEPGRFLMGSPDGRGMDDEHPQHAVTISQPFWLGQTEVTQAQWQAVMGWNPSEFDFDPRMPVERVTWFDAVKYCERLSAKTGMTFRLPTEAEWEYACRSGSTTDYFFGDDASQLKDFGWHRDDFDDAIRTRPHPVGCLQPNSWGLYDMLGNLWEWCADWYEGDYYARSPDTDPKGPVDFTGWRVCRGGCWGNLSVTCRAAYRTHLADPANRDSNLGFRVARTP